MSDKTIAEGVVELIETNPELSLDGYRDVREKYHLTHDEAVEAQQRFKRMWTRYMDALKDGATPTQVFRACAAGFHLENIDETTLPFLDETTGFYERVNQEDGYFGAKGYYFNLRMSSVSHKTAVAAYELGRDIMIDFATLAMSLRRHNRGRISHEQILEYISDKSPQQRRELSNIITGATQEQRDQLAELFGSTAT